MGLTPMAVLRIKADSKQSIRRAAFLLVYEIASRAELDASRFITPYFRTLIQILSRF